MRKTLTDTFPWDPYYPNFDKLLLCLSNLFFLAPLSIGLYLCNYVGVLSITASGLASMVHHAVEERFGFPSLVKVDSEWRRSLFLQVDRLFAALAMIVNFRWFDLTGYWLSLFVLLGLMLSSEIIIMLPSLSNRRKRMGRCFLHTLWHVGAFCFAALVLSYENQCQ
jgi:hypothetical protein